MWITDKLNPQGTPPSPPRPGPRSPRRLPPSLPRARHPARGPRAGTLAVAAWILIASLSPARPQTSGEPTTQDLRREIQQLRQDYEQRIRLLEERLRQMETRDKAPAPATNTTARSVVPPASAPATSPASPAGSPARDAAAATDRHGEFAREEFQRDTEARERALSRDDDKPIRERVEQVLKDFMDIGGYLRAGYGVTSEGGTQVAFQAPGAMSKYRLGNEADNYGELVLGKNWYLPGLFSLDPEQRPTGVPTGPVARAQLRLAFSDDYATHDFRTSFPEAWGSVGNVFGANPTAKFWAGNRFYRRHDIHVTDFFFYNMSGYGGGLEDFRLGPGKLALAWIGNSAESGVFTDVILPDPANQAGYTKRSVDLRYYDLALPLGRGELGFAFATGESGKDAFGNEAPDTDGIALNFVHTRERFLSESGVNKLSVQWGTGYAKTFSSGFEMYQTNGTYYILPDAEDSWRFRLTEHFTTQLSPHFSIGPVLVYQYTDARGTQGEQQWLSAGVRPILHFNRYLSLAFEGGVDYVDASATRTRDYLYKLTLAPQVSLGGEFMSRPVIRGFATYGHWGDDFVGQVGGRDFQDANHGWTWGVQMEAWW